MPSTGSASGSTSARPSSGAFTSAEKIVTNAVIDRIAANSIDEQVRPDVDLVLRLGARLLDRTRLDDGEQSLRVTARTGAASARARSTAVARGSVAAGGAAAGAAAPRAATGERGLALARPLEQVRGDAALVFGDRVAGVGAAAATGAASSAGAASPASARRSLGRAASSASSPSTGRPSALRRSRLRFSRCSGTSAMRSPPLRPRAVRRCRRPCGLARSGRP